MIMIYSFIKLRSKAWSETACNGEPKLVGKLAIVPGLHSKRRYAQGLCQITTELKTEEKKYDFWNSDECVIMLNFE